MTHASTAASPSARPEAPAALVPPGTPIAVVAPSHAYDPQRFNAGLAMARAAGHDLRVPDDLLQPHRYFAAPDHVRRDALARALTDPEIGAVWAVRGGSGVLRLLDGLPWHTLQPRPLIGFSDLTPLLGALVDRGAVVVHGPVLHSLPDTDPGDVDALWRLLDGRPTGPLRGEAWVPGEARGPLVGGNLCMLAAACGTPWQLDAAGKLLCLEEVGEAPYRVDRSLQQLRQAGVLRDVAGVLFGTFTGCDAPAEAPWSLRDVLLDHTAGLGVPVVGGLPFGHGPRNHPLPLGATGWVRDGEIGW